MARTKFTFEKRQRERARQQKQQEKAARRSEAKQLKSGMGPELQEDNPGEPEMASDVSSLPAVAVAEDP